MSNWIRRLFVIVSIGGGFAGCAITTDQIFQSDQSLGFYVVSIVVALAYAAGIYGGVKLIEDEERGMSFLSWYFVAQIPYLISPVFSYQFTSGFTAFAALGSNGSSWGIFYGGRWMFSLLQSGDSGFAFGANFFALWAAWYLRMMLKRKKTEAELPALEE
jgi:hypothetical protein